MICSPLSVILLSFLQMTWTWWSRDSSPAVVSFFRLGPGWGMGPINQPERVNLTLPIWLLPPHTPSRTTRAFLPITARIKPSSTQEWCLFSPGHEILEQIAGTSSLVTLSIYIQKTVGSLMGRKLSCSTCVNSSDIFHLHFSLCCYPDNLCFPYLQTPTGWYDYYWPSFHFYH